MDDRNVFRAISQVSEVRMKSERPRTLRGSIVWQEAHQPKDLGYTDTTKLMIPLKEVRKGLNAYSKSLTPDSS